MCAKSAAIGFFFPTGTRVDRDTGTTGAHEDFPEPVESNGHPRCLWKHVRGGGVKAGGTGVQAGGAEGGRVWTGLPCLPPVGQTWPASAIRRQQPARFQAAASVGWI